MGRKPKNLSSASPVSSRTTPPNKASSISNSTLQAGPAGVNGEGLREKQQIQTSCRWGRRGMAERGQGKVENKNEMSEGEQGHEVHVLGLRLADREGV